MSVDLLTDVPGQTLSTWDSTLDQVLALAPDHLSVYLLTLEDPEAAGLATVDGDHLPVRAGARRWRKTATGTRRARKAARPTSVPRVKHMALSWNGGTVPLAAVRSASSDHMRIAERPDAVAMMCPCRYVHRLPERRPLLNNSRDPLPTGAQ